MTITIAAVLGVVVGYGLGLWRESRRERDCERGCYALREYRRTRLQQDAMITALFAENEKLARMMVLQVACARTRTEAP